MASFLNSVTWRGNPTVVKSVSPFEIWPITDGGSYINPDWSRTNVGNDDANIPDDAPLPEPPDGEDSGRGGGCFIMDALF